MTPYRPLRLVEEPRTYTGRDAETGEELLLRVYPDGTHTLATRIDSSATWGPEIEFAPSESGWAS